MARRMTHPAAGRVGHPPVPASPVAEGPAGAALTPHGTAASRPPRMWWVGLLLLPGGLLLALGLGIAWVGVVCALPGLRRIAAAWGGPAVAPEQPHGEPHEPGPRVPWAACGERGSSTGEPPSLTGEPGRALEALGALPWNRGLHPLLWTPTPPRMWAPSKEVH